MKTKQKQTTYPLFEERSYRKCFSDATNLLMAEMAVFFHAFWLPSLLAGIIVSALIFVPIQAPLAVMFLIFAVGVVLFIFVLANSLKGQTQMLKKYNMALADNPEVALLPLTLKGLMKNVSESLGAFYLLVVQFAVLAVLAFATYELVQHFNTFYPWVGFGLIALFLMIPFNLSLSHQLYLDGNLFVSLKWAFQRTLRHFGSTLVLLVLSFIFIAILGFFCYLPLFVLNMAMGASDASVMLGDPTDLPVYVPVLRMLLGILLLGVVSFSLLLWSLPQAFHFCSLRTREQNKTVR